MLDLVGWLLVHFLRIETGETGGIGAGVASREYLVDEIA